jgi:hypothetical protein
VPRRVVTVAPVGHKHSGHSGVGPAAGGPRRRVVGGLNSPSSVFWRTWLPCAAAGDAPPTPGPLASAGTVAEAVGLSLRGTK